MVLGRAFKACRRSSRAAAAVCLATCLLRADFCTSSTSGREGLPRGSSCTAERICLAPRALRARTGTSATRSVATNEGAWSEPPWRAILSCRSVMKCLVSRSRR